MGAQNRGMEECAALVREMLERRGFAAEVLGTAGAPVVYAEREGRSGRTLLFYNHYDVQPPEPLELWETPPFEPAIRNGKLYARGVSDDKGHIVTRLAALAAITALHGAYDVAAAADLRLIPQTLEPIWAGWEVVFASSPMVLAYDPSVAAFAGINGTNWVSRLEAPGTLLGVANASVDPNGYNAIFVLELQGLVFNGSLDAVYGHFFTTPPGSLAVANPATTRVVPETQAATLLQTHQVQAFLTYEAYATSHGLAYVSLDPRVNLGSFDPVRIAGYAQASTTLLTGSGTVVQTGFPVAYGVTVPANAPNATLGQLFVHLLVSPPGRALLEANGFVPLVPAQADRVEALPALLRPDVVSLEPGLAQALG